MVRNKKGWLRIVESIMASLLIFASVLIIFGNKTISTEDSLALQAQRILDELALNNSLRSVILDYDASKPYSDPINKVILIELENFVRTKLPGTRYNFTISVCDANLLCSINQFPSDSSKEVYAAERVISANIESQTYSPKKIKVALWIK